MKAGTCCSLFMSHTEKQRPMRLNHKVSSKTVCLTACLTSSHVTQHLQWAAGRCGLCEELHVQKQTLSFKPCGKMRLEELGVEGAW